MKQRVWQVFMIIFCLSILGNSAFAQKAKKHPNGSVTEEAVVSISVPYTIEINEDSIKKGAIITLAVDTVTIVRCPEKPLKILFGRGDGIDFSESEPDKGQEDINETNPCRNEIYLRPRIAKVNTNLVIQMKSGPVALQIQIIEVKGGAHTGNYTGEIIITNSAYKNELALTMASLDQAKLENTKLKDEIATLKIAHNEKVVAACQESQADLVKLVESLIQINDRRNLTSTSKSQWQISQIGKLQKTSRGYILSFAIENNSKQFISLDDISTNTVGSNIIRASRPGRKISPKAEGRFSCLIEVEPLEDISNIPTTINLIINGTPVTLKIS